MSFSGLVSKVRGFVPCRLDFRRSKNLMLGAAAFAVLSLPLNSSFAQLRNPGQTNRVPAAGQQKQESSQLQTVAVVNRQPISRIRLGQLCAERFGKEVLEAMVNKMLVEEECRRLGIQVTAQDIENELQRVAKNFNISVKKYLEIIADGRNVPPEKVRGEITWLGLALRRIADKSVEVTDQEVNQGLDKEYGRRVSLRLIAANNQADAKALLQAVQSEPKSFGKIAKDYSKDPATAPYEGLVRTPFRQGEMPPEIDRVIFALQEKEISNIVESGGRFFIFQCNQIHPAIKLSKEQRASIFEIKRDQIREAKLKKTAPGVFKKLQNQAKIQIVHGNKQLSAKHPGIAAIVNNQPVRMSDLAEECISRSGAQILNIEIARTILKQEVKRHNITVTQSDLHAEIDRAAEEAGFVDINGKVDRNGWLNRVTENDPSKIASYIDDAVWLSCALRKLVEKDVKVTPADMQKAFVANYGPRVRALAIVLTDARSAEKVWRMARDNPNEENFRKLAETYSAEMTSRYNRGTVQPIARFSGRPQLEEAAFKLKENEISGIINEGKNWMILFCKGQTNPVIKNIEEVKDILYKRLIERKIIMAANAKMVKLHESSEIDNFLSPKSQISKRALENFKQNQKNRRLQR